MLIEFLMITNGDEISYKVLGKKENNTLIFKDKSVFNTFMHLSIFPDMVEIKRVGDTQMLQQFKKGVKLSGYYKNNQGIDLEIASYAKEVLISENEIYVEYDYYLEKEWQSSNKLKIIF